MSSSSLNDLLLSLTKQEFKEIIRETIQEEFQRMLSPNGGGIVAKSEDQPMTVEECAAFLHLSKSTIYNLRAKRGLPYMKRGKRLYFSKSDLLSYLKSGRKATTEEIKEAADISILKN